MRKLQAAFAVISICFTLTPLQCLQAQDMTPPIFDDLMPTVIVNHEYPKTINDRLFTIKNMLLKQPSINRAAINKVLSVLRCTSHSNLDNISTLTIIDYSLPSNRKRLWVFDLNNFKLLFNTYVSHGIKSGVLLSSYFSNKYDSKASSMGVYKADKSYYGRHGLSLKLNGLDYGFNDNADGRAIVMHGGWYVNEQFIKRYGRAGRSWGCPAIPANLTHSLINTIKENSIFVAYYPSEKWFLKSKFLKCDYVTSIPYKSGTNQSIGEIEQRDEILFADVHQHHRSDNAPVIVIPADCYGRIFHAKPPLTRMLRRQINNMEYIALNSSEFQTLAINHDTTIPYEDKTIYFVTADIKMIRGYYATEMKIIDNGHIMDIKFDSNVSDNLKQGQRYIVNFETNRSIAVKPSKQFIRWIGL